MRGILILSQGRDIVLLALVPQSHDLVHSFLFDFRTLSLTKAWNLAYAKAGKYVKTEITEILDRGRRLGRPRT